MAGTDEIRQRIATYSLVSQGFEGTRDPIAALIPFLAPIANDLAGQEFDAPRFRAEMRSRYGIVLSRDVTEVFVERLLSMRLLAARAAGGGQAWVKQAAPRETIAEKDALLDDVIDCAESLHKSRIDLLKSSFNEDGFLDGLMSVLLSQHRLLKSAVDAVEGNSDVSTTTPDPLIRTATPDEYFASEFIRWTSENRPDLFSWMADLSGTAFVAEALIGIRTPKLNQTIRPNVTVYLDGPFLMELLGCSGQSERDDAKLIVDTLQSQRIPVSVLEHSLRELAGNIKGVLSARPTERKGPTAKALLYRQVTEDYLSNVLNNPEHFINQLNITLVDPSRLKHLSSDDAFSADMEQSFYAAIYGAYENETALSRDISSVSWIMQRRKGETSRDVLKSKHILLTRNTLLSRSANKFCVDHCRYSRLSAGPVILARDLAGILWLLVGQSERLELSRRQLILSCDRARSTAPGVVSAMFNALKMINQSNADLFWAAVQNPSYLSMALDAVNGTRGAISQAALDDTLAAIRLDLIAEERSQTTDKLERQKEQFDAEAAMQRLVNESLQKEKKDLIDSNQKLVDHLQTASKAAWDKRSREADVALIVCRVAVNLIMIGVAVAGSIFGTDFVTTNWVWKAVVGTIAFLIGVYGANAAIPVWLTARVSSIYTQRYKGDVSVLAGAFASEVLIATPILSK